MKLPLLSTLLMWAGLLQAQDFRVLAVRGPVEVVQGESHTGTGPGRSLSVSQTLELGPGSYIGLLHQSGATLELKAPGKYALADLARTALKQNKQTLSSRYANYVLEEITKTDKGRTSAERNRNYRQYMAVTGSVERGTADNAAIRLLTPLQTSVLGQQPVSVSWVPVPGAGTYTVTLTNRYDEVVSTLEAPKSEIAVPLKSLPGKGEQVYFLTVRAKNKPTLYSAPLLLKVVPEAEAQTMQQELAQLHTGAEESRALNALVEATYLEEHQLYLDALLAYQQAVRLEPEVTEYQTLLKQYRQRVGLE
ncbi:hypothetical protein LJY25_05155 [Hymenobacter sp. BT175]|uniref:hypothetical protein n=1 Tax=Hymenobacter translucens TaxID=2886507 RepID=UPI001D0DCAAE|nr:hypothetical protein [Hymenobacter translucens]MCC2545822.1 hypothetical protein [Hymenobacter translucens]